MRESHFKKDQDKMHAGASFGKSDGPVSNFQNSYDGEKRLSHALTEFGRLFSELKTVGFSKEELQITLLPSPERFAVSIKRKGDARLGFSEINLIFRIAVNLGLTPRTIEDGVEVFATPSMLESANLYSKALLLIRDCVDSSFSGETK